MKQPLAISTLTTLTLLGLSAVATAQDTTAAQDDAATREKESAAESAATEWLYYVDAGEYITAWNDAATMFKDQVTPDAWQDAASKARGPLGKLRSRARKTIRYATMLPGAPDGEYVLLQFDAVFENKAAAVESVATVLDNGVWRVTGYFIR